MKLTLSSTSLTQLVEGYKTPFTVTLKSSDATRKLEFSTDGTEFFTPAIDTNSSTQVVVVVNAPIMSIKATGVANDTLIFNFN